MKLFITDLRQKGHSFMLDSPLVDFFGLSYVTNNDLYAGPPSFPVYTVIKSHTSGDAILEEEQVVLALTSPDAQLNHLGALCLKFFADLHPILQEVFNFGRQLSKTYVMTVNGTFHCIPYDYLQKTSIEQWETVIEPLFHDIENQNWNPSIVKTFFNFIAHGEEEFVDKTLKKLCTVLEAQLEKCSPTFTEYFWQSQEKIELCFDILTQFCWERCFFSPAGINRKLSTHPFYVPGESAPFGKGWSKETFSSKFLQQMQKTTNIFETALRGNLMLYFDPGLFNKVSIIFKDVAELKSVLSNIMKECRRRQIAVTEFDTLLQSLKDPYKTHTQVRLMRSSGFYPQLQLNHFLKTLRSLAQDKVTEQITRFMAGIFVEPNLFLLIEADNNVFIDAFQNVGKRLNVEIDWEALVRMKRIDATLVSWFSPFTLVSIMRNIIYLEQKKNASFTVRLFLPPHKDYGPFSKDPNNIRQFIFRLLEQGDPHATLSIVNAMASDQDYMLTFFSILKESSTNHKIIHSGVIWLTVALVFQQVPTSLTKENKLIVYNLFISAINSLLLLSSLQVFYTKIKKFLSSIHQSGIEKALKARHTADEYFECFFDFRDPYGAVSPKLELEFTTKATRFSYVFFGVFYATFIREESEYQVQVLNFFRNVLHQNRHLRRVFMKPDFRKIMYDTILTSMFFVPLKELQNLFERDWTEVYAADIIGKPILGHFEKETLKDIKVLGQRSKLVRAFRIPQAAVAVIFSENFDFVQNELNRLMRVQGHPHITRLYGFVVENDDHIGILVEYCEGGSLEKHLSNPEAEVRDKYVLSWSQQAASGILFLHDNQIVHGSITTKSMMLNARHEKLKILVIGRSKMREDGKMKSSDTGASKDEEPTKEVDVYSLASSILRIFERLPLSHDENETSGSHTKSINLLNSYITRLLGANPAERSTMQEVYNAFTTIKAGEEVKYESRMGTSSRMTQKQKIKLNVEELNMQPMIEFLDLTLLRLPESEITSQTDNPSSRTEAAAGSQSVVQTVETGNPLGLPRGNRISRDELRVLIENLSQIIKIPPSEPEFADKETELERARFIFSAMNNFPNKAEVRKLGAEALYKFLPTTVELLSEEEKRSTVSLLLQTMEADFESVSAFHCGAGLSNFEPSYLDAHRVIDDLRKMLVFHSGNTGGYHSTASLLFNMSTIPEQRPDIRAYGGIELGASLLYIEIKDELKAWVYAVVWSFLNNVTVDLPEHRNRLLQIEIVNLFDHCFNTCDDKRILIPMLIAIGNVAEVETLRSQLLNEKLLAIMIQLLSDAESLLMVGFLSSEIISLLLLEEWTSISYLKATVEEKLVQKLATWDYEVELKVVYNSLNKFRQILDHENVAAKHWALCTLHYLIHQNSGKYCPMLDKHGFIPLLESLSTKAEDPKLVDRSWAILENVNMFKQRENPISLQTPSL